ncbi:MAG: type II secretion system protein GspK [Verrucomicrobiota bacterium]|nr:type II secretion system protein GspK [Verrucomicrobiota bacterium]
MSEIARRSSAVCGGDQGGSAWGRKRQGSILILALWTLFVLSMLAVAVARLALSDIELARRMRARTTAYYLARAGVERAILQAAGNTNGWDGWTSDERNFQDVPLGAGTYTVSVERPADSERGAMICYGVVGEESKVNINKADAALLAAVVRVAGGESASVSSEITKSIVDWRDADDTVLTGGAEASYYRGQSQPYSCPNRDFQSLQELLLVKGVRPELFRNIRSRVTLFGSDKINFNAAGQAVLLSVAEAAGGGPLPAGESLVGKLLAFREAGHAFREATADAMRAELDRFAGLSSDEKVLFAGMARYATIRSTCFGGTAEGHAGPQGGSGGETRRIAFVFDRDSLKKLYWHEY